MSQLFSHILGQDDAIQTILRADAAGRLPHGLVFSGPTGVGKATTAIALAKYFLCDQGEDAHAMKLIDSGTHPDFRIIRKELVREIKKDSKATTLSIDVIRDHLLEPASHKPLLGKGKFFVVEEADLMQAPAQNSLLKTLEEPFGRTMIVLLTIKPEDLLPTIRSRTQTIHFAALPDKTIITQLKLRGIDPAMADLATQMVDGSLGTAMQWIEDGVVERGDELTKHLYGLSIGRPTVQMGDWLAAAAGQYAEKQIEHDELTSKDRATRDGIAVYLRLAARYFRTRFKESDDPETLEHFCQAIDSIVQTEQYLESNVNISLALQQLGASLASHFAR